MGYLHFNFPDNLFDFSKGNAFLDDCWHFDDFLAFCFNYPLNFSHLNISNDLINFYFLHNFFFDIGLAYFFDMNRHFLALFDHSVNQYISISVDL